MATTNDMTIYLNEIRELHELLEVLKGFFHEPTKFEHLQATAKYA